MKGSVESKRENEKKMVGKMIKAYCRGHHHEREGELCADCQALYDYACARVDKCPFMEEKSFCSNCRVHCYRGEMREKIRDVMRYAGPRMMLTDPVPALRHMVSTMKEKRRIKKEDSNG